MWVWLSYYTYGLVVNVIRKADQLCVAFSLDRFFFCPYDALTCKRVSKPYNTHRRKISLLFVTRITNKISF